MTKVSIEPCKGENIHLPVAMLSLYELIDLQDALSSAKEMISWTFWVLVESSIELI